MIFKLEQRRAGNIIINILFYVSVYVLTGNPLYSSYDLRQRHRRRRSIYVSYSERVEVPQILLVRATRKVNISLLRTYFIRHVRFTAGVRPLKKNKKNNGTREKKTGFD